MTLQVVSINRNKLEVYNTMHETFFDEIVNLLCKEKKPDAMKEILTELFTQSELETLTLRWALMRELSDGATQRDIASRYNISLCKITRGAKLLKDDTSQMHKIFIKKKEKKK